MMNRFVFIVLGVVASVAVQAQLQSTSADATRAKQILEAMNSYPDEWIAPIKAENIRIVNGTGRVEVNEKAKFSYYVQTENPQNPQSTIYLIPMSTSRYTPASYQTDDWWDAHKQEISNARHNHQPVPRQDPAEVKAWLAQMKLSSNPTVLEVTPGQPTKTLHLQEFLQDYYLKHFVVDGKIKLYRGGPNDQETQDWLAGRLPYGARYWTPTATYGWRYARKVPGFLRDLVAGHEPLYVFEVPVQEFVSMTSGQHPQLTLGTEMTRTVHDIFDHEGRFADQLLGNSDYLGVGDMGLEFELRADTAGAHNMQQTFQHSVKIEELVQDRVQLIRETLQRMKRALPEQAAQLDSEYATRIQSVEVEGQLLLAIQLNMSRNTLQSLSQHMGGMAEIANVDEISLSQFLNQAAQGMGTADNAKVAEELATLNKRIPLNE